MKLRFIIGAWFGKLALRLGGYACLPEIKTKPKPPKTIEINSHFELFKIRYRLPHVDHRDPKFDIMNKYNREQAVKHIANSFYRDVVHPNIQFKNSKDLFCGEYEASNYIYAELELYMDRRWMESH